MGRVEDAIIFAAQKHCGQVRKTNKLPYILHPIEVAEIVASITDNEDAIIAGLLHDVLEDTQTTVEELRDAFGARILELVLSETEDKQRDRAPEETWLNRKEMTLAKLRESNDKDVKIIWLADKLANIRALCRGKEQLGDNLWTHFHQHDPAMHEWYYRSVYEIVSQELGNTEACIELGQRITKMWENEG